MSLKFVLLIASLFVLEGNAIIPLDTVVSNSLSNTILGSAGGITSAVSPLPNILTNIVEMTTKAAFSVINTVLNVSKPVLNVGNCLSSLINSITELATKAITDVKVCVNGSLDKTDAYVQNVLGKISSALQPSILSIDIKSIVSSLTNVTGLSQQLLGSDACVAPITTNLQKSLTAVVDSVTVKCLINA